YVVLFLVIAACTLVRFWGLGNVGLHGDEETMAMPAMSILENGRPMLPGGMFYPRALAQLYLMAASVWVFGETEWALRLPSALVGSLAGFARCFRGKRFLSPNLNLVFVAAMTFMPYMIEISQTARMYVFWLTALMAFGALLFKWEQDDKLGSLVWAFAAWLVALHFQQLSIFAALLSLFPGLSRQSIRQLLFGDVALGIAYLAFDAAQSWIGSQYPLDERPERIVLPPEPVAPSAGLGPLDVLAIYVALGGLALVGVAAIYRRT